jgi:hypothetical protein
MNIDLDALKAFLNARFDEQEAAAEAPAFVLADVAAKRRMLKAWPDTFGNWTADQADAAKAMKEKMLCLLALPYADQPDYRPEWKR